MQTPTTSLMTLFLDAVAAAPDAPALTWQGQTWSYNELARGASRVAAGLRAWGLRRGERVALAVENSPEFVLTYLGVGLAGGVVVPVNTLYRAGELRHILSDAGASLAVCSGAAAAEMAALRQDLPDLRDLAVVGAPLPHGALPWSALDAPPAAISTPDPHSLAMLVYTSGTTGRPKGAMLSHANLAANIQAVMQAWGWTAADRLLLTLPLFHIHGLGVGLHGTLASGASLDLRPRFDAVEVLDALATGQYTLFFGVPTMYTRLLAAAQTRPDRPSGVRLFVSGSAPLPPDVFAAFETVFGQPILERYGMTETGMLTTNPLHGPRRPGSVGYPFPRQQVLVGAPGEPLPPGEVGPVWTAGPNVFQGYWQRPEATAEAFRDGWFDTGDLGFIDEAGALRLVGRARELIITGGFNVYPREVEETLQTHPGVQEAAVIGLPDPDLGEQVVACVVPRAPAPSADELMEFCRARLAPYKKPRQVIFVAELPRNAMGKIVKSALRSQLE